MGLFCLYQKQITLQRLITELSTSLTSQQMLSRTIRQNRPGLNLTIQVRRLIFKMVHGTPVWQPALENDWVTKTSRLPPLETPPNDPLPSAAFSCLMPMQVLMSWTH